MATGFDSTLAGLGIARTAVGNGASNAAATNKSSSASLGQSDFLKLMTTQLKNQDPFDPVDNTQMVAQMAQFSSVAGISEMNTTLKAMAEKLNATGTADAIGYVGRTVLTEGDTAYPRTGGGIAGAVELDAAASDVAVTIASPDGTTLKTVNMGRQAAGTVSFDWDGTTDAGEDAGAGPFTVSARARGADAGGGAKAIAARTLVWSPVRSVSTTTGAALLTLPGLGQVPVTAVRQIG